MLQEILTDDCPELTILLVPPFLFNEARTTEVNLMEDT